MAQLDDSIWTAIAASDEPWMGPPASPSAITDFESRFALSLPPSHRQFLLRANGGSFGVIRLFGIDRSDEQDLANEIIESRLHIPGMTEGLVFPIANDWGGSYYCYDLRRLRVDGEYPVLYWDHDYSEDEVDPDRAWSEYAPDFATFVQKSLGREV